MRDVIFYFGHGSVGRRSSGKHDSRRIMAERYSKASVSTRYKPNNFQVWNMAHQGDSCSQMQPSPLPYLHKVQTDRGRLCLYCHRHDPMSTPMHMPMLHCSCLLVVLVLLVPALPVPTIHVDPCRESRRGQARPLLLLQSLPWQESGAITQQLLYCVLTGRNVTLAHLALDILNHAVACTSSHPSLLTHCYPICTIHLFSSSRDSPALPVLFCHVLSCPVLSSPLLSAQLRTSVVIRTVAQSYRRDQPLHQTNISANARPSGHLLIDICSLHPRPASVLPSSALEGPWAAEPLEHSIASTYSTGTTGILSAEHPTVRLAVAPKCTHCSLHPDLILDCRQQHICPQSSH